MIPLKDDNPTASFPWVTIGLITINCLVFLYQFSLGVYGMQKFILKAGAIPYEITHIKDIYPVASVPIPLTLFSAMFMHGGFTHIIGNMLYLWIFGDNVEDAMGHIRFIFFYLLCGILASMLHILTDVNSTIPMVGASGAIAGILGAYFILYPRTRVLTLIFFFFFIRIIRIPAVIILGFWFILQILNAQSGGGVAWYAHIGGFLAGALLIEPFTNRKVKVLRRRRW
jgi:membrane associated rhomboid family serine protease